MTRDEEAAHLLALHGGELRPVLDQLERHLGVLQSRSALLLTVATLALTITGFSGPRIAEASALSRYGLACGLVLVLAGMVVTLLGTLRVSWLTQLVDGRPAPVVVASALAYRAAKTRLFQVQLLLLVLGLACYVFAVIAFLVAPGARSVGPL